MSLRNLHFRLRVQRNQFLKGVAQVGTNYTAFSLEERVQMQLLRARRCS